MRFEWLAAVRFLKEGRSQTWLIITGVAVGVGIIIFLVGLINGLQKSLIAKTLGTQAHIVLRPPEDENRRLYFPNKTIVMPRIEKRAQRLRSIEQWQKVVAAVRQMPDVTAASPLVSGAAFAVRGNANRSIALLGIEPGSYLYIVDLGQRLVQGHLRWTGKDAVIGIELAKELGLSTGDKIRLVAQNGRSDVYTVVGLLDMGNLDLNRRWAFVTLRSAQSLLDLTGGVTQIDLTVREIFSAETIARQIAARTGLVADSWMKTNAELLVALSNQRMTSAIIQLFVIIAVALGIASVLAVSVVQKSRDIGILRAMGATPGRILRVFLLQGGIVGLLGSILGCGIGVVLLLLFSRFARNADGSPLLPVALEPRLFLIASIVATLTGLVAATLPARRAARLDPVVAIRYGG
jgi:lipoprotein-releasing system permease protein